MWHEKIARSQSALNSFYEQGDEAVAAFSDEEATGVILTDSAGTKKRVNLFWTNTQIMQTVLYSRVPAPSISRRFQDANDDVSRVAGIILERTLSQYEEKSDSIYKQVIEDLLLPGMGQVWVRYEFKSETETDPVTGIQYPKIVDQSVHLDYVHWKDFFYQPVRSWNDVGWAARRIWMSEDTIKNRWPDTWSFVQKAKQDSSSDTELDELYEVFEIWDKSSKKVYFECEGYSLQDPIDDPLQLAGFFPCPKPLMANTTNNSLIPKSDYSMTAYQYEELNMLNTRIYQLEKALRVTGVYDKNTGSLKALLTEAKCNELIPVDNWALFAEKGGLKGVIDWFPIDMVASALDKLVAQRTLVISQIYELIGISDIVRGISGDRETATTSQIKSNYASTRLNGPQKKVANFIQEVISIKSEIISKFFTPQSLVLQSNVGETYDINLVEPAIRLIKSSIYQFKIKVSADQISLPDYSAEKQARTEFLTAMSQMLGQAFQFIQMAPQAMPFVLKMVQWTAAGFKNGDELEGILDEALRTLEQKPVQNQDDSQANAEMQQKDKEFQQKMQMDGQIAAQRMQIEQMKAQHGMQLAAQKAEFDAQLQRYAKQQELMLKFFEMVNSPEKDSKEDT